MHPTHQRPDSGQRTEDATSSTATGNTATNSQPVRRRGKRRARCDDGDAAQRPAAAPRASLYDEVTQRIVAELEAGRFPWVQPWSASAAAAHPGGSGLAPGLPRNAVTARNYSGVNILTLWCAVIEHGHPSQNWLTFKQAQAAGGCVRKGERGVAIVYADRFIPRDRIAAAQQGDAFSGKPESARAAENGKDPKTIAFLKRFTVFNVAQCDGLDPGLANDPAPLDQREIVPVAEALIAASGVDFRIGSTRAFYTPSHDFVAVPPQSAFFEQINYYRTCLHELTHATGHPSRLARTLTTDFGSKDYAREELVAELGSAFLCAALGIVPTVRHADYLASWLDVLREDNRAIFRAASAASKASDWLLARRGESNGSHAPDTEPASGTDSASHRIAVTRAEARP